jgi:hypothetical protein
MKAINLLKTGMMLIIVLASVKVRAQDTIRFIWQANGNKSVEVKATLLGNFRINWGDATSETTVGVGQDNPYAVYTHNYSTNGEYTVTISASANCHFFAFNCNGTYSASNQIRNLTLINCSALTELRCTYNLLTNLDLTLCPNLTNLDCSGNQFPNLDFLSTCPNLTELSCNRNQLTTLDISKCPNLTELWCNYNQLTELNLSYCPNLTRLWCDENQLTGLDLKNCPDLDMLICDNNQLINLDITGCSSLRYLSVMYNKLTTLDLSNFLALTDLYCKNNQLTNLNLSGCLALNELGCQNNHLQLSDLYAGHLLVGNQDKKFLGKQTISQTIMQNDMVDFSTQKIFGGISTNFVIEKNAAPAPQIDYSIDNGKITFNNLGIYTVTMTNDAIVSHTEHPAMVVAAVNVGDVGIVETQCIASLPRIYPNPTSDKFIVDFDGIASVKLYNMFGQEVLTQTVNGKTEININHLPQGVYNVRIFSDGKVVGNSKIMK